MSSISTSSTDDAASAVVGGTSDIVDVATINSWLDQLKMIGVELCDDNGNPVVVTEENAADIANAVKAVAAQQSTADSGEDLSDEDGEVLPPFELPEMYRESSNRESLSESSAYANHLNEHWGF